MTTVAVIQPYFYPYAGYFRLFAAADVVVMFDCVQFPRRGWVHRNRFARTNGELDWLTLPIAKADRNIRIDELRWTNDAAARLESEIRRFPELERARAMAHPQLRRMLDLGDADVAAYLCGRVADVASALGLARPTVRSSTLGIDPALHAQERVVTIVEALGGTRYVNPSGGRELYDHARFERSGIVLRFLSTYAGSYESVLSRLLREEPGDLSAEVERETVLEV